MQSTHVGEARGSIWRLADGDTETVVAFSVAAWAASGCSRPALTTRP